MRSDDSYEATDTRRDAGELALSESIAITELRVPADVPAPSAGSDAAGVREAAAGLRDFRRTHGLRGITIRQLIDGD